jgi:asparagine synthase (glutamine-hydrolysing)
MFMGVYTRSGDAARHLDRARPAESEMLVRGPFAIAWSPEATVACAEVDGITCFMSGYLYEAGDAARRLAVGATSDAELVARAYQRLGEQALLELRGRFAVLLWDEPRQRGLLSSDLFGIEPLFFWRGPGRLAFAGEHRDLMDLLPSTPGPDRLAFTSWLGGGMCPADRTLLDGLSHLRAAHLIDLGVAGEPARRYWQPRYAGTMKGTRADFVEGLREQIERSVAKRLSPRSSGVVLSGGLDSSIVTAAATRVRTSAEPLRTYSMLFPGAPYDEGWKVRGVASALDIEANAFELAPQGALWLCLRNIERFNQPLIGAGGLIDTASVFEAGNDGVDVLMDGQTGDETLGFAPYLLADRLMRGRVLGALSLTRRWPIGQVVPLRERLKLLRRLGVKGAVPYRVGRRVRSRRSHEGLGPVWLGPAARREYMEMQDVWAWKLGASGPRWWQYLSDRLVESPHREMRLDYLRHRATIAGLVNESPLYDFDLVDYCLKLPPELAFESAHTRPLAREAMRGLLPDEVRLNDQKANFSAYCYETLTGADAPGIDRLLMAPDAELGAYADMEWIRRQWQHDRPKPGTGTGPWGTAIWRVVAAECWLRAQADPSFVENMLARPDVLPLQTRPIGLEDARVVSHPAGA